MDARVSQNEIPKVYDSLSKTYDIWGKLAETRARNRTLELADIRDDQNILEEFKRVLKKGWKLILVNMTEGQTFGCGIYSLLYCISPKSFGGCRGVKISNKLQQNGFDVKKREYFQQWWFPSEVILAIK